MIDTSEGMVRQSIIVDVKLKGVEKFKSTMKMIAKQSDSFTGVLRMNLQDWRGINQQGLKFNTLGGRLANRFRMLTHGLRGFRMEMLGVMFFGMGLQRFFTGLLKPALDATGIFKLWTDVLTVLFLPVVITLLPYLLGFMNWLMNLPEPLKQVIGWFTIAGVVLGTILFLIGMFALGLGSLVIAGNMTKVMGFLEALGVWTPSAALTKWFGAGGLLWKLGGLLVIVLAAKFVFDSLKDTSVNLWSDLSNAAMLTFGFRALGVVKGPFLPIFAATAAVLIGLDTTFHVISKGADMTIRDILGASVANVFAGAYIGFLVGGPAGAIAGGVIVFSLTALALLTLKYDWFTPKGFETPDKISRMPKEILGSQQDWDVYAKNIGIVIPASLETFSESMKTNVTKASTTFDFWANGQGKGTIPTVTGQVVSGFDTMGTTLYDNWNSTLSDVRDNTDTYVGLINDTLDGIEVPDLPPIILKGANVELPNATGFGNINFSPTYNISVSDKAEMQRMIDNNSKEMYNALLGLIKQ